MLGRSIKLLRRRIGLTGVGSSQPSSEMVSDFELQKMRHRKHL